MKKVYAKNYSAIVRKAPAKIKAKGKVSLKCWGVCGAPDGMTGGRQNFNRTAGVAQGPSLRQFLRGLALTNALVIVNIDANITLRGRVVSVDGDGFEIVITGTQMQNIFPVGSIVFITFAQLNAVAAV